MCDTFPDLFAVKSQSIHKVVCLMKRAVIFFLNYQHCSEPEVAKKFNKCIVFSHAKTFWQHAVIRISIFEARSACTIAAIGTCQIAIS